ncbi:MAG: hypothetical protein ABEJ57_01870 [Halobacteriaceae archaeon]
MTLLSTGGVTAGDVAVANLAGWAVVIVGLLVTIAWLFSLYR